MTLDLTGKARPCPLCGSQFIVSETKGDDYRFTVYIQCGQCGLKGYHGFTRKVSENDGLARTLNYWNTRATDQEEKQNVES